jgi:hypothetical protein
LTRLRDETKQQGEGVSRRGVNFGHASAVDHTSAKAQGESGAEGDYSDTIVITVMP